MIDYLLGLKILRIEIPETKQDVYDLCIETAEMNKDAFDDDDEHRLLIDVSRGVLGIYEGIDGIHQGYNLIIADFPLNGQFRVWQNYLQLALIM